MSCNWRRIGIGSTFAVALALASMFTPADRLSAAQPSERVDFKVENKNVTISEGVAGLTITSVEDTDGSERETLVKVADPSELKKASETHRYFLYYQKNCGEMRDSGKSGGGGNVYMVGYTLDGKDVCVIEGDRGIVIVMEEMAKGKRKKTVIRAANAEELAKKHPEAYCYHLWYRRDTSQLNVWSGSGSSSGSKPIPRRGR